MSLIKKILIVLNSINRASGRRSVEHDKSSIKKHNKLKTIVCKQLHTVQTYVFLQIITTLMEWPTLKPAKVSVYKDLHIATFVRFSR